MFLYPSFIYAIPFAIVLLGLLYIQSRRRRKQRIQKLSANQWVTETTSNHCHIRSRLKLLFIVCGLALLMTALARPRLGFNWSQPQTSESSMLVLLDLSQSMKVEDLYPNRLERAKMLVREIAESRIASKSGLLVFAGSPFLQCPMTRDLPAFLSSLKVQTPSLMHEQGSNLANTLMMLPEILQEDRETTVILVSDGEDHSLRLDSALRFLQREGIKVHTICVGSRRGGLIPAEDNTNETEPYLLDNKGNVVYSKADPARMQRIAEVLGGTHTHIASENFSIRTLLKQLIAIRNTRTTEGLPQKVPVEHYQWPLLIAFLLFALETAMGNRKPTAETTGS